MMKERDSNIELLKLIAIVLIVIAHSVPCYGDSAAACYIQVEAASRSASHFIASFFWYFGMLGNSLFVVTTSWFLQKDDTIKVRKLAHLVFDLLFFSLLFLALFFFTRKAFSWPLGLKNQVRQFFPLLFNNNWFITCYLLLYLVHPFLNKILQHSSKSQLQFALLLGCFISCAQFIQRESYYYNDFLGFCYLYLCVGYTRLYMPDLCVNRPKNLGLLIGSVVILVILLLMINTVGLKISALSRSMCRLRTLTNPLIVVFGIAFFNLMKMRSFSSKTINLLASSSLYLYLIHENYLVKTLLKPVIWREIYEAFDWSFVICWILLFALISFAVCFGIFIAYKSSLRRICYRTIDKVLSRVSEE